MMLNNKFLLYFLLFFLATSLLKANSLDDLMRLKKAYPDFIKSVDDKNILWTDGTRMPVGRPSNRSFEEKIENPVLLDQLTLKYPKGDLKHPPRDDPGRIRYEPFFKKMYGSSEPEVQNHLATIYWLPNIFGQKYPLSVTTINSVDKQLKKVSDELETFVLKHPEMIPFLDNPAGTFKFRFIANSKNLSTHSYGIAIDINPNITDYWQWDLVLVANQPITENQIIHYKNRLPIEIVKIFEKHGFIWGGKWYHYDTMHFEYRPELLNN